MVNKSGNRDVLSLTEASPVAYPVKVSWIGLSRGVVHFQQAVHATYICNHMNHQRIKMVDMACLNVTILAFFFFS